MEAAQYFCCYSCTAPVCVNIFFVGDHLSYAEAFPDWSRHYAWQKESSLWVLWRIGMWHLMYWYGMVWMLSRVCWYLSLRCLLDVYVWKLLLLFLGSLACKHAYYFWASTAHPLSKTVPKHNVVSEIHIHRTHAADLCYDSDGDSLRADLWFSHFLAGGVVSISYLII